MKLIVSLALVLTGSGCLTVSPAGSGSAKPPSIVLEGVTAEEVSNAFLENCFEQGWTLQSQTPNQLVFWREDQRFGSMVLLGSQYDPTPTAELRVLLVSVPNGVRVMPQASYVTNEGSAFERRTALTSRGIYEDLQAGLEDLRANFEARRAEQAGDTEPAAEIE